MQSQHFKHVYFRQTTRFLKFRFWFSPGPSATQCQPRGPGTEDDMHVTSQQGYVTQYFYLTTTNHFALKIILYMLLEISRSLETIKTYTNQYLVSNDNNENISRIKQDMRNR
jgi:hypothetical protein